MNIRCIAIDDEPLALEKISGYVAKVPFLELVGKFPSAIPALNFLNENIVDLVFLDIQMDELTGIQMLEVLKNKPKIIFTTAYDQYALKGYELDVADYLLKPITFERFLKAVNKVQGELSRKNIPANEQVYSKSSLPSKEYVFIKNGPKIERVFIDDILFIEGMKEYLRIHTSENRVMTLMSFKKMEELLPMTKFARVHKSYIVAIDKIDCIESQQIKIHDVYIPIGDMYKKDFYDKIKTKGNI